MNVWYLDTGDITPLDTSGLRLRRGGILTKVLSESGHNVLWWTSDFRHNTKSFQFGRDVKMEIIPGYFIRFIHGPGYKNNISLQRLTDHHFVARKFYIEALGEKSPDIIISSCPTLDMSAAAVKYGKLRHIPVVLDIRDLWPDVFMEAFPKLLRPFAWPLLFPYERMAKNACKGATAILGHAPAFVEWGAKKGKRMRTEMDRDFPFGYEKITLTSEEDKEMAQYWNSLGVCTDGSVPICCFLGGIGHQTDFDIVHEAVEKIINKNKIQFVFCGEGPKQTEVKTMFKLLPEAIFPGWVSAKQIWKLMTISSFALVPYKDNAGGFSITLSNKMIEYMAGGLPILSSIDHGYLADLINEFKMGITYGGNSDRLANAIIELLEHPDRQLTMANNSRKLFEKKFRAEVVYSDYVKHLESIKNLYRNY